MKNKENKNPAESMKPVESPVDTESTVSTEAASPADVAIVTEDANLQTQPRSPDVIREEFLRHNKNCAAARYEQGKLLNEVKGQADHGEWLPWLRSVNFDERRAERLMKIATYYPNSDMLETYGQSKALALLRVSAGDRERFLKEPHLVPSKDNELESKTVLEMGVRQLDYAIRVHNGTMPQESSPVLEEGSKPKNSPDNLLEQTRSNIISLLKRKNALKDKSPYPSH